MSEGMDTFRALVDYGEPGSVAAYVESLIAQRDALLAALKDIVTTYEAYDAMTGQGHEDCVSIARGAIRKAEG